MLKLIDIRKDYASADETVHALRGVSIQFRRNEFVSILGPSGCGKTTLLNIIGGLDRYTGGDLQISGRSTKEFADRDWDTYRNHSIGFVFQNYNLIPHQTVLANVELALTLSGVPKEERRRRAKEALERVGLGNQIHKKPNQMSGGQMQRVAIARALVNDPEILLADEPTGALDTKTSVQVMDLLREIAKDRLVIMVTHNPDLANEYSTRIIRLKDGEVTDDTDPYDGAEEEPVLADLTQTKKSKKNKRLRSMSFFTALSLSLNNLMTKKARTFLTSFAGSIGIIGIALILALSNGIHLFIEQMQEDTLSSYPITLQAETLDMSSMLTSLMGESEGKEEHDMDKVYSSVVMYELMDKLLNAEKTSNNLTAFKRYLESEDSEIRKYASAIQYGYGLDLYVYTSDETTGEVVRVDGTEIFSSAMGDISSSSMMSSYSTLMTSSSTMQLWEELLAGKEDENGNAAPISDLLKEQYDLVAGEWPDAANEVVLVVNGRNEISDTVLYAIGLKDRTELSDLMASILTGDEYTGEVESWTYEEIMNKEFRLVLPTDFYVKDPISGLWVDTSADKAMLDMTVENGLPLHISGIIRPNPDATATALSGSLGYTYMLTDYIINNVADSNIVKEQSLPENENYDVLTGLPFEITAENELTAEEKREAFIAYVNALNTKDRAELYLKIQSTPDDAWLDAQVQTTMDTMFASEEPGKYDRGKMEAMVYETMGTQSSLVEIYVSHLSDEKLAEMIKDAVRKMIATGYADGVRKRLEETFCNTFVASVKGTLTDSSMKIAYLAQDYSQSTGVPAEQFATYLMSLSAEELDAKVLALAQKQASAALEEGSAYLAFCNTAFDLMLQGDAGTVAVLYDKHMPATTSESTLENNLQLFGAVNAEAPAKIVIYASTFDNKEAIAADIEKYNEGVENSDDKISYTDYVKIFVSSITILVDAVSYVLIAFVSISLVVSSIMIGIITYISVLERTKEIGILRAVGASKRDVSRVFNAETLIVGAGAGFIGIVVTVLLCLPINAIIAYLSGIGSIRASLPLVAALILVALSMFLTWIAGLIPSLIASKKDPVVALRTE